MCLSDGVISTLVALTYSILFTGATTTQPAPASRAENHSDFSDQSVAIVPPEMLCDWLRNAFNLSETQSQAYLNLTFHEHRRKREEKILMEDLCKQLSVLEADKHPYYAPETFFVRIPLRHFAYIYTVKSNLRHICFQQNRIE